MKSKIYLFGCLALVLMFSLDSCKPKESAYKAAYDAAKAREINDNEINGNEWNGSYANNSDAVPVTKPATPAVTASPAVPAPVVNVSSSDVAQKEKVTAIDGAGIQQYSVVIGSFSNKTNASSLKERMANDGFTSFLAQNERGMYRVIVATFGDKASAIAERNRVKSKYYPNYQDSWVLDNQ